MRDTITDNTIRQLRAEAVQADDPTMVELCNSALRGNEDHRRHCAIVVEYAKGEAACASSG